MLEKIAGEDDVQRVGFHLPFPRTILMQESNFRRNSKASFRIQVHRELLGRSDVINKFSPSSAQIQNLGVRVDVKREKVRTQNLPYCVTIVFQVPEPELVCAFEALRLCVHCESHHSFGKSSVPNGAELKISEPGKQRK